MVKIHFLQRKNASTRIRTIGKSMFGGKNEKKQIFKNFPENFLGWAGRTLCDLRTRKIRDYKSFLNKEVCKKIKLKGLELSKKLNLNSTQFSKNSEGTLDGGKIEKFKDRARFLIALISLYI